MEKKHYSYRAISRTEQGFWVQFLRSELFNLEESGFSFAGFDILFLGCTGNLIRITVFKSLGSNKTLTEMSEQIYFLIFHLFMKFLNTILEHTFCVFISLININLTVHYPCSNLLISSNSQLTIISVTSSISWYLSQMNPVYISYTVSLRPQQGRRDGLDM